MTPHAAPPHGISTYAPTNASVKHLTKTMMHADPVQHRAGQGNSRAALVVAGISGLVGTSGARGAAGGARAVGADGDLTSAAGRAARALGSSRERAGRASVAGLGARLGKGASGAAARKRQRHRPAVSSHMNCLKCTCHPSSKSGTATAPLHCTALHVHAPHHHNRALTHQAGQPPVVASGAWPASTAAVPAAQVVHSAAAPAE